MDEKGFFWKKKVEYRCPCLRSWPILTIAIFLNFTHPSCFCSAATLLAQDHSAGEQPQQSEGSVSIEPGTLRDLEQKMTQLALAESGLHWDDERKWGGTREVYHGFKFRRDPGGKLETERRKRVVNHGTWERYSAKLRPGAEHLKITLHEISSEGAKAPTKVRISVRGTIDIETRQALWQRGLQVYSVSALGWADAELMVEATVRVRTDYSEFPPAIIVDPVVTGAAVTLHEFKIDRVSKLGGEFAQQVTRVADDIVREKIAEKNASLVEKMNQQIGKNRKHLRFSPSGPEWPVWLRSPEKLPESAIWGNAEAIRM